MKLNNKKILKLFTVLFLVIVAVVFLVFFAFYNDSSRTSIINYAVKYLQSDNFSLKLEGVNENLTQIDRVVVKFSDNLLEAYDIGFERAKLFSRARVNVKKVVLRAFKEKNERKGVISKQKFDEKKIASKKSDNIDFGMNLRETLSTVKKMNLFIESLKIAEMLIVRDNQTFKYENLSYHSENNRECLSMRTGQSSGNLVLDESNFGTLKGDFKNIEGFSGNLTVNQVESNEPNYDIEVNNSECKVNAKGALANKLNTILISNALVKYQDKKHNFSGKILLNKNKARLFTILSLSDFIDISNIPFEITKNFQNISTSIVIEKKEKSIHSDIEFKRDDNRLGNCRIVLQGKHLSLQSDVSWVNFIGYKLKTFDVHSENLKNFTVNISGTDILGDIFKISSEVIYANHVCIQKFVCDMKQGKIVLNRPLVLNELSDTSLQFDFRSLSFLKKYCNINGSAIGNLLLKNGLLGVDAKINRFVNENFEMYDGRVSGNLKDLNIDVKSAKFMGNILKNVMLKKKVIR